MGPWNLEGRVAIVTGAARGIGQATARRLVERGMRVVVSDLADSEIESVAAALGDNAIAVACDVRSSEDLERLAEMTQATFGPASVLVANAGVNVVGSFQATPAHQWEDVLNVNLLGVTRTARAALPQILDQRGYIMTVASVAAFLPLPLGANYTAAKHGVHGFTQTLRLELHHTGVDVGCAYFGAIDTEMVRISATDPAVEKMLASTSSLLTRAVSADVAARAIERGIVERRRRVFAPKRIWPALDGAALINPLVARATRNSTSEAVELANARVRHGEPLVATRPPSGDAVQQTLE